MLLERLSRWRAKHVFGYGYLNSRKRSFSFSLSNFITHMNWHKNEHRQSRRSFSRGESLSVLCTVQTSKRSWWDQNLPIGCKIEQRWKLARTNQPVSEETHESSIGIRTQPVYAYLFRKKTIIIVNFRQSFDTQHAPTVTLFLQFHSQPPLKRSG